MCIESPLNARGRVSATTFPSSSQQHPARTVEYDHAVGGDDNVKNDGNPLISSVEDPQGTIVTEVDLLGRVISYEDVWGNTTTSTYDQAGRLTDKSGPVGDEHFEIDDSGRLQSQALDDEVLAVPSYDSAGELESVDYPSGTGQAGNGTELDQLVRDDYGRVTELHWRKTGETTDFATDRVVRSQSGRVRENFIDTLPDANPADDNFEYDGAGRLTQAWVPGRHAQYAFDASGGCGSLVAAGKNTNRTSLTVDGGTAITYCYNGADQLTSTSDSRYTTIQYDERGNTTLLGDESMSYDGADRHTTTVKGLTTIEYRRDATDRVVERRVGGVPTQRYGFARQGDASVVTMNALGTITERTISLPGGVVLTLRPLGEVWSYPNIHGDVMAIGDGDGVKQGSTRTYDPFGAALSTLPDNSDGNYDYGWLGQHQKGTEHEAGVESIEMSARLYAPGLGRFLEVDPVDGGSDNDYEYAFGDPITSFDLTGECGVFGNPFNPCGADHRGASSLGNWVNSRFWDGVGWAGGYLTNLFGGYSCGDHIRCYNNTWWLFWADGFTFGHTVFCSDDCSPELVTHETVHVRQFERYGVAFPFLYGWQLIFNGWHCSNIYERPAYGTSGGC